MKLWKKFSLLAAVVLLMFTWRPALAIVVNALYDFVEIGTPAPPGSGFGRIYFDSTGHLLSSKNSSGTVTHTVATVDCSSGSQLLQKINADGSGTCASGGGGGGGFIQTLTAPVFASFSNYNFNVGTGVITTRVNGTTPVNFITLRQQDPNHTGNVVAVVKPIIGATYTMTVGLSEVSADTTNGMDGPVFLNDGGSNSIFFGTYASSAPQTFYIIFCTSLTNAGGGATLVYSSGTTGTQWGPLAWLRVQETASNRIYSVSSDGQTFYQVFSESNTAHFTTAQYGIGTFYFNGGAVSYDGGISMYSFTDTTP